MIHILCVISALCFTVLSVQAGFKVPQVLVEVLSPRGFQVSIPDEEGISLFAFHGRLNEEVINREAGEFSVDVTKARNGRWTYKNNIRLKLNDVLYYWVNVDYDDGNGKRGYILDDQQFVVTDLGNASTPAVQNCRTSTTVYDGGKTACIGSLILEDKFEGSSIDFSKWVVEHKIPTYSEPNFEFNSYENRIETRFLMDNTLYIQPVALKDDASVRGTLDLTQGCTSSVEIECYYTYGSAFLLPPVKSAKIKSKTSFKYGKIEIKAKLPAGDWIIPVLQLEPKNGNGEGSRIWIAYSRGNNHLSGNAGDDIGSRLLFAGPVLKFTEPERSQKLVSRRSEVSYNDDFHVYTVEWTRDRLKFYFDGEEYGNRDVRDLQIDNTEYVLSLGLSVGGLNDFPDGYSSDDRSKPWLNTEKFYIKKFFEARNDWIPTWSGTKSALQVQYVKITSL